MRIGSGNDFSASRILSSQNSQINKNTAKLSSGKAINSAADNAAGLSISQKMFSQINGTNQAIANSQTGMSLVQTAESAIGSTQNSLQRMRELAVQSSNSTLNDSDRTALKAEFSQLKESISKTAQNTTFNGQKVLDGSLNAQIATGPDGQGIDVSVGDMSSSGLNIENISVDSFDSASSAISQIDTALEAVSSQRGNLGATSNRLETEVSNLMSSESSLQVSQSQILDTDMAKETMELTKNKILQQANTAIQAYKKQELSSVLSLLK